MARTVAVSMPPITPVPMSFWLAAPAPVEMARGVTPAMKASDVIRIGRRRRRAASLAASRGDLPARSAASANSTIRMAFLADRPMVVSRPTWK